MTAGLHALYHHGVRALIFDALGKFQIGNYGNNFYTRRMKFFKIRNRVSRAQGDKGGLFLANDVDYLVFVGRHKHHVYAERIFSQLSATANFFASIFRCASAGAYHTCAAGFGHRRGQSRIGNPRHAALNNGIFNA